MSLSSRSALLRCCFLSSLRRSVSAWSWRLRTGTHQPRHWLRLRFAPTAWAATAMPCSGRVVAQHPGIRRRYRLLGRAQAMYRFCLERRLAGLGLEKRARWSLAGLGGSPRTRARVRRRAGPPDACASGTVAHGEALVTASVGTAQGRAWSCGHGTGRAWTFALGLGRVPSEQRTSSARWLWLCVAITSLDPSTALRHRLLLIPASTTNI